MANGSANGTSKVYQIIIGIIVSIALAVVAGLQGLNLAQGNRIEETLTGIDDRQRQIIDRVSAIETRNGVQDTRLDSQNDRINSNNALIDRLFDRFRTGP